MTSDISGVSLGYGGGAGGGGTWGQIGQDGGGAGNGLRERDVNVDVGRELVKRLQSRFPTLYVQGVGVETEASIAKKQKFMKDCLEEKGFGYSDCLAINLHCNGATDSSARGVECYTDCAGIEDFAVNLVQCVANWFGTKVRGKKTAKGSRAAFIANDIYSC